MIETTRLKFRRFTVQDLASVLELETNPEIMKFAPSRFPLSPEKIEARLSSWIEKDFGPLGIFAAETKSTGEFVGWFMLMPGEPPELGFMIPQRLWGKGYATEGALGLIHYAAALGYQSLRAATDLGHEASSRVLTKAGFKKSKVYRKHDPALNKEIELEEYLLLIHP